MFTQGAVLNCLQRKRICGVATVALGCPWHMRLNKVMKMKLAKMLNKIPLRWNKS